MTVLSPLPAATVSPAVAPGAPEVEPPPSAPSGASTAPRETNWYAQQAGVEIGQVWTDKDPRGGPTFRIVALEAQYAEVENTHKPLRRRRVLINRLPRSYRLCETGECR